MKNLFEKQLNESQPLTEDTLKDLQIKTYFNGDEKKVGDVVLFAMLMGNVIEKDKEVPELPLNLITLNEKHFDLFKYEERHTGSGDVPVIQLKTNK